jgi:hypothetical protein
MTVAQTGVDQLYAETAGPVFAYCYARVGSRDLADWAVTATFDRARAALGNGGIPDPQLDWLLRTADKFCAPSLRSDGAAVGVESVIVLQDWRGRSFDEIESELRARQVRLEVERNRLTPWRRVLGAFNLGPAFSWAKGLFAGASVVKATAAAIAVVGAIAVVATPVATKLHHAVRPSSDKPAPSSGPSVPSGGALPSVAAPSGQSAVPAAAAGGAAATGGKPAKNGVGSGAGVTTSVAPAAPPTVHASGGTGGPRQQALSGGSAQAQSGPGARPADRAAAPGETVKPTSGQNDSNTVSIPKVTPPSVTTPAVTTPTVSVPETPTTPSTPDAPTVPSVSAPTATVPTVSTPDAPSVTVPSVPSVPSPPSVSGGGAPSPPSVSTPSVPPPPPAPAVTTPTVTLPGH